MGESEMKDDQTYLKEKPKCPKCGKAMELDYIDYNFKGNQDECWICDENCRISAFVRVRYNKAIDIKYTNEDAKTIEYKRL